MAFLLALLVATATTGVNEELIDAPVLDLLAEGEHTQLLHDMQLPRVIKIQNISEEGGVPIEIVLFISHTVIIAQLQNGLFRVAS
jgi:hypothetical protein